MQASWLAMSIAEPPEPAIKNQAMRQMMDNLIEGDSPS